MKHEDIISRQEAYGFAAMQEMINSGQCWHMEGSIGREAMALLESGACMLPQKRNRDYYGNTVPSRDDLKEGTKGTFQNSVKFWTMVDNGEIVIDEFEDFDE